MKTMSGMLMVSHTLGILVCAGVAVLNAYWGHRMLSAAFLFFMLVNIAGAYTNYREFQKE